MDVLAANLGEIAKWLAITGIALILVAALMQVNILTPGKGAPEQSFWQIMADALKKQFTLAFAADTPPATRLLAIGFILIELAIIAGVAGIAAGAAAAAGGGGGSTPTPTPTPTPTAT